MYLTHTMGKIGRGLLLASGLLLITLPAAAQEETTETQTTQEQPGFFAGIWDTVKAGQYYAGLSLGTAGADGSAGELEQALAGRGYPSTVSLDDSDTGYRLYLGWQFHDLVSAEFGYANFGELSQSVTGSTADPAGFLTALAEEQPLMSSGITLGVASGMQLNELGLEDSEFSRNFGIYGRAGLYLWKTEVEYQAGTVTINQDDSGTDLYFGIGARYTLFEDFDVALGYDHYGAETAVDMVNLSVNYRFDLGWLD